MTLSRDTLGINHLNCTTISLNFLTFLTGTAFLLSVSTRYWKKQYNNVLIKGVVACGCSSINITDSAPKTNPH